ncbi:MAG: DUF1800 family protein [Burkholderiaceae bacterium]|nr:DUF1800 family protein [Burkholderiaceae bacterium]
MIRSFPWRMLVASTMLVVTLLAGCGGGEEADASPEASNQKSHSAATESADVATPTSAMTAGHAPPAGSLALDVHETDERPTVFAQAVTGSGGETAATLNVRARGVVAGGVWPAMELRINGVSIGTVEVRSTELADYRFKASGLAAGAKVEVVHTNNALVDGVKRDLFIAHLQSSAATLVPYAPDVVFDRGAGAKAFDGIDLLPGQGNLIWSGALRYTWPPAQTPDATLASQNDAARFLHQATFGPTPAEIARLSTMTKTAWLNEQIAMPYRAEFVPYIESKYQLGDEYRPWGSKYSTSWVGQRFMATAATGTDQLRKRMAYALHQILMIAQTDTSLWPHARAYAQYLDTLNRHALGNYRSLLEDIALSPAMGIYLSHLHNRKEDPATGRLPDENFARELMQLFTIGLLELNLDGTPKLGSDGQPIETYTNADVMALAKVFTGWSWAFADTELTDYNFRKGVPVLTSAAADKRIDLQRMKAYPGQHSTAEKSLFAGKPHAVLIPANSSAQDSLRMALDALFNHPNVGPFISRQLIQHLVTSHPSPAYVARVAARFNDNGSGVRGDLKAVVRTILIDTEARSSPGAQFGKLREPILRATNWMRAFGVTSKTGDYLVGGELDALNQRPMYSPTVFGYYRPGYVPPNTQLAAANLNAPEFQIVSESTTAQWVNQAENMAGSGMGWTGTARELSSGYDVQAALVAAGNVDGLLQNLNQLLFAGRMSTALRQQILDAVGGVNGNTGASHLNRARVAVFVALSSPEYLVQR